MKKKKLNQSFKFYIDEINFKIECLINDIVRDEVTDLEILKQIILIKNEVESISELNGMIMLNKITN